jgi:POT family proton-dependent oligopeptide transporter
MRPTQYPLSSVDGTENMSLDPKSIDEGLVSHNSDNDEARNQQLSDAAQALHVMPIMGMLPMFWMLYDQQGSVWTLQATRMDLHGIQPGAPDIV